MGHGRTSEELHVEIIASVTIKCICVNNLGFLEEENIRGIRLFQVQRRRPTCVVFDDVESQ